MIVSCCEQATTPLLVSSLQAALQAWQPPSQMLPDSGFHLCAVLCRGACCSALPAPADVWSTSHVPESYLPIIQDEYMVGLGWLQGRGSGGSSLLTQQTVSASPTSTHSAMSTQSPTRPAPRFSVATPGGQQPHRWCAPP